MRRAYKTIKNNNIVNIVQLLNIFKLNYFEQTFSSDDKISMKNDWVKVGEDLRWGIRQNKMH